MKKFASIFAVVMALVICLGAMTACSNGADEETKKPTTSTSGDKNESKPTESKPTESKPAGDKNEESTQPSTGDNNVPTETQPAGDNGESKPEEDTNAQG
ncbi:MAG: hypothetical protein IKY59_00785 [Oscillospiraceae bacterium]|nr:hypothetical protein [Oscillospiraceae bacterium]